MSASSAAKLADDRATAAGGLSRKVVLQRVALYAPRQPIYQREVRGPWQDMRAALLFILAGFYLALPWVGWSGRQAVWFDVPGRKFYLFGLTFWPQDFIYLAGLLILAALSLFFFTNLAGRLWCGYACPQTVWTKFFMWIEWLVEGDRNRRIMLDRGPWNRARILRKATKHAAWLAFSCAVGVTFVGYFIPIRELLPRIASADLGGGEIVFVTIAWLALYFDAGFMREQICKYACPYARFQGAMFDRNTLSIFYDRTRGEPRGHRRRGADSSGLGSCVDCNLCVHVCPTGIDIRNGTQSECIGCAACIDACDQVMTEVGYPKGLIRYTTESALAGEEMSLLRPRVVAYGAVLTVVAGALAVGLARRAPLDVDVIRDRARLYRELSGGLVENVYTLKLMNKSQHEQTYFVSADAGFTLVAPPLVVVAPGEIKDVPVQVRANRRSLAATSTPLAFVVASVDADVSVTETGSFLAPASMVRANADKEETR